LEEKSLTTTHFKESEYSKYRCTVDLLLDSLGKGVEVLWLWSIQLCNG